MHFLLAAAIPFLLQPVGSLMSIPFLDSFSQRHGLVLSSALMVTNLVMLHYARVASTALLASIVAGLSIGFASPSATGYLAEYSEPKFRGFLSFSILLVANTASFCSTFIASTVDWRTLVLICAFVPLLSMLLLTLVRKTPGGVIVMRYDAMNSTVHGNFLD